MGVDARWLCNTCMTVCHADGARDYLTKKEVTVPDLDTLISEIGNLKQWMELDELDTKLRYLQNLRGWLKRHEGHKIWLTNDHSIDSVELEPYKTEEVDGVVSELTREQEYEVACKNAKAENTKKIKGIIDKHKNPQDAAEEIASMFIYPYGY